jgi:hypothetical protein
MGLWLMYLPRNVRNDCAMYEDAEELLEIFEKDLEEFVEKKLEE